MSDQTPRPLKLDKNGSLRYSVDQATNSGGFKLPAKKKHPSALKCERSNARKTVYRGRVRVSTRTQVKKARNLLASDSLPEAAEAIQVAISALDKAAEKGVIHKNNAARRKSRLMAALAKAKAAA